MSKTSRKEGKGKEKSQIMDKRSRVMTHHCCPHCPLSQVRVWSVEICTRMHEDGRTSKTSQKEGEGEEKVK
jgi:hypothetical protein